MSPAAALVWPEVRSRNWSRNGIREGFPGVAGIPGVNEPARGLYLQVGAIIGKDRIFTLRGRITLTPCASIHTYIHGLHSCQAIARVPGSWPKRCILLVIEARHPRTLRTRDAIDIFRGAAGYSCVMLIKQCQQ